MLAIGRGLHHLPRTILVCHGSEFQGPLLAVSVRVGHELSHAVLWQHARCPRRCPQAVIKHLLGFGPLGVAKLHLACLCRQQIGPELGRQHRVLDCSHGALHPRWLPVVGDCCSLGCGHVRVGLASHTDAAILWRLRFVTRTDWHRHRRRVRCHRRECIAHGLVVGVVIGVLLVLAALQHLLASVQRVLALLLFQLVGALHVATGSRPQHRKRTHKSHLLLPN